MFFKNFTVPMYIKNFSVNVFGVVFKGIFGNVIEDVFLDLEFKILVG